MGQMKLERNGRSGERSLNSIRDLKIDIDYLPNAEGSCMISLGGTVVICAASLEARVPPFIKNTGSGWVTAEYGMLPRSTNTRMQRESVRGGQNGRTQEIQRLISRSLRAAVNLLQLGERQITVDCDVIKADGGTRTASITGGYIALHLALRRLHERHIVRNIPVTRHVCAISCGIINGEYLLDLDYNEDSSADVDANFVFGSDDSLIEIQCGAEKKTFNGDGLARMLDFASAASKTIFKKQLEALQITT